jgi:hypothetical protein
MDGLGYRAAGQPAPQRRLSGLAVRAAVVLALDPGGAQPAQLAWLAVCYLDQELPPHGGEEPFDLSPSLKPAGRRMGDLDAELRDRSFQRGVDKGSMTGGVAMRGSRSLG